MESSIGSSLSNGFQVYLSKSLDLDMSPGCMIRLVFFLSLSSLFQQVDLVTASLRACSKSTSLSHGSALCSKAARSDLLGVESHFWVLCFFLVNCLGGWNQ